MKYCWHRHEFPKVFKAIDRTSKTICSSQENCFEIMISTSIKSVSSSIRPADQFNLTKTTLTVSDQTFTLQIHTYIIGITTLQSGLLTQFLTPLMLCVLIINISGGTYSLKSTPNDRFEKLFMAILFMVISFLQRRCHPVTRCIKQIADQPPVIM